MSLVLGIFPKSCSPDSKQSHFSVQQNGPCKCLMSLLFFSRQKGSLLKTNFWSFSFLFFFQGTTYSYEWELITHPKDYSGEMEGKHSQTLKLSKVKLLLLGVLLYGMPSEENRNPGSQERLV